MVFVGKLTRICLFACILLIPGRAHAVLFYDTGDPTHNTTAPTGAYADSGWQYEGTFGNFLGTMIGSQYFVTAQHIGVASNTFVSDAKFNGVADVTYNVDTSANGGVGYWDIPGSDLRVYKIVQTFSSYAQLYTGTGEVGQTLVVNGMGGGRGNSIFVDSGLGPVLKGWGGSGTDAVARWGTNQFSSIVPASQSPVGELLVAQFNALPGTDEATLTGGDSGGGVFIKDNGVWKLAGVNYAIDGSFSTTTPPKDSNSFAADLFDKGGLWEGSDASGWTFNPDTPIDNPSQFYASRVSDYTLPLDSIIGVPEPGALVLAALGFMLCFAPRRRRLLGGHQPLRLACAAWKALPVCT